MSILTKTTRTDQRDKIESLKIENYLAKKELIIECYKFEISMEDAEKKFRRYYFGKVVK